MTFRIRTATDAYYCMPRFLHIFSYGFPLYFVHFFDTISYSFTANILAVFFTKKLENTTLEISASTESLFLVCRYSNSGGLVSKKTKARLCTSSSVRDSNVDFSRFCYSRCRCLLDLEIVRERMSCVTTVSNVRTEVRTGASLVLPC